MYSSLDTHNLSGAIVVICALWCSSSWHLLSKEKILKLFESWQSRYGKLYHSWHETSKRLGIFRSNLEYNNAHNKFLEVLAEILAPEVLAEISSYKDLMGNVVYMV